MPSSRSKRKIRKKLREKQDGKCCYCLVQLTPAQTKDQLNTRETLEHLDRRANGGMSNLDNLALACFECNNGRGNIDWMTYTSYVRGELYE